MPYLIQKQADGTLAQQWPLLDATLVFGRSQEADIKIDDLEMSKRHFLIERKGDSYFIRDLNSANGTWINQKQVKEAELKPGDIVIAGKTSFAFEKGLTTVIGEMAQENKGYKTILDEIVKSTDPRPPRG